MTEAELNELQKLANAATPGPWGFNSYSRVDSLDAALRAAFRDFMKELEARGWPDSDEPLTCDERDRLHHLEPVVCHVPAHHGDTAVGRHHADAEFIAASRKAVPALIEEVKMLRAILRVYEGALDDQHAEIVRLTALLEDGKGGEA